MSIESYNYFCNHKSHICNIFNEKNIVEVLFDMERYSIRNEALYNVRKNRIPFL